MKHPRRVSLNTQDVSFYLRKIKERAKRQLFSSLDLFCGKRKKTAGTTSTQTDFAKRNISISKKQMPHLFCAEFSNSHVFYMYMCMRAQIMLVFRKNQNTLESETGKGTPAGSHRSAPIKKKKYAPHEV